MKNGRRIIAALMIATIGAFSTGCFGTFALTKKVYDWNDSVTGNKFVKSLLFWGLTIIPVYGVSLFLDVIIFNLIEFWGGSNPVAMNEGDMEEQHFAYKGVNYRMVATKNKFELTALDGPKAGTVEVLRFNPVKKSWNYEDACQSVELMTFTGDDLNTVVVNNPGGENITFRISDEMSACEMAAQFNSQNNGVVTASVH